MTDLVFFIVAGLALLIAFVILGLQVPTKEADVAAVAAMNQMVNLGTASFVQADQLVDDTEYLLLRTERELYPVAAQLRRVRRELTLEWIDVLLSDLRTLWRFRQFMIRRGAPTRPGEEWAIVKSLVVSVIFLKLLKLLVLVLGPFAFARVARRASRTVNVMSRAAAGLLERVPSAGWTDLRRAWTSNAI